MYQYQVTLADAEQAVVNASDVGSDLTVDERHYVDVNGTALIEVQMRAGGAFRTQTSLTNDDIVINKAGINAFRITATGATTVTIDGR